MSPPQSHLERDSALTICCDSERLVECVQNLSDAAGTADNELSPKRICPPSAGRLTAGGAWQARALMTQTECNLRGNNPAERYAQALQDARSNASGQQSAAKVMNEGMLLEALGPKVALLHCLQPPLRPC